MSAINAKASRKMKKYAVLTREPRCFLGSFDFSWEQRKLGDISEIKTGPFGSTLHADDYVSDGTPIITTEHFKTGALPRSKNGLPQVSDSDYKRLTAYTLDDGDIVFSRVGSVDINALITPFQSNWLFSGRVLRVRPQTDISSKFLHTRLETESIKTDIRTRAVGQTMPSINTEILKITPLVLPSSAAEQEQIGSYFAALDNLITLHQRKCALLFSPFQAFISMMFTTSTFSWEQRKLSEITDKVTEKNAGLQYVETFTNSAEFGIISQRDFFDHDIAKLGSLDGYYIVKNEDFVYNPRISTSAPVGPINRNKLGRTGVMSPLYTVFRPHDIDTTYLEYFFKCGYWHSFMNFNGDSGARSDRFSIRDNVFFQMPIPIPDIDEQRKIGELLTCLDNLITLHQRKCIFFTGRAGRLISTVNKKRITSSWEQRKAIDIADYSKGNGYSKGDLTDAGTPIILYGRLYTKYQFAISEVDTFAVPRNGAVYSQGNEVIVPASGETAEDIARASAVEKSGVLLGGDLNILRPFDFINPLFLALAISNGEPQKELAKKAQGKSVVHIHNTDIQEVTIAYPSRTEQDRIVSVFRQLDHLITLHQRKPFLMKWRTSDANRNQTNRLVL